MKKNYVKIVDEKLLHTFDIEENDIVEVLSKNKIKDSDVYPNFTVRTSHGRELIVVEWQFVSLGNSLRERILSAGIENCFFYGEYYDSYDRGKFLMNIDEARYKVINNYKITLKKVDAQESFNHFYLSDLDSMIERGHVMFLIKAPQK